MLKYRFLTKEELNDFNLKCQTLLNNHMQCNRRVTRFVAEIPLCEGHFQVALQHAWAKGEETQELESGADTSE